MQLPQKIQTLLKPDSQSFLCCSGKDYQKLFRTHSQKQSAKLFEKLLNQIGELSSKAQGLKSIITSALKFMGTDHRIYIKIKDNKALGFVKVGEKNLFHRDYIGNVKQIKPTCVLDIYVHQSCQRNGIGKEVFQKFIREQGKIPEKLAYDRPSEKLISFLKKHYGLVKYIPQNNNFVVFQKYFQKSLTSAYKPSNRPQSHIPTSTRQFKQQKSSQNKNTANLPEKQLIKKQQNPKNMMKTEEEKVQNNFHQLKLTEDQKPADRQFKKQMLLQNKINNYKPINLNNTLGSNLTFRTTYNNMTSNQNNQKNTNSQAFPFSVNYKPMQNPTLRTTSNAYGSHYRRR